MAGGILTGPKAERRDTLSLMFVGSVLVQSVAKAAGSSPRGSVNGDGVASPQASDSLCM